MCSFILSFIERLLCRILTWQQKQHPPRLGSRHPAREEVLIRAMHRGLAAQFGVIKKPTVLWESPVLGGREDFPGKGSRKERSQPIREGHQHDWASGREALMCLKMRDRGFPAVQWWGHRASPAGGVCSIPGEGTKILKAAQCGPTKKRWERKSLWLMGAHGDNSPGMVGPAGSWLGLAVCLLSLPTWLLQPPHTVDTGQASYMMLTFHETHRSCKAFYDLAWKSLLLHSVGQRESQA